MRGKLIPFIVFIMLILITFVDSIVVIKTPVDHGLPMKQEITDNEKEMNMYDKRNTRAPPSWMESRLTVSSGDSTTPQMAISGTNIHVVWSDGRDGNYEIYYKKSTDNGVSWSGDTRLTCSGNLDSKPKIDVNGNNIHVVWQDETIGATCYIKSTDNGNTWSGITVWDWTSYPPSYSYDPIINPDVAVDGTYVYIVAQSYVGDIIFKRGSDNGNTWTDWILVIDFGWPPPIALIETNGHSIYIVYMCGSMSGQHLRQIESWDEGDTWDNDCLIYFADTANNMEFLMCFACSMQGYSLHVVYSLDYTNRGVYSTWYGMLSGNGEASFDVYEDHIVWDEEDTNNYRQLYSNKYGQITDYPSNSYYPTIGSSSDFVHVIWVDNRDGNNELYYSQRGMYSDLVVSNSNIKFNPSSPVIKGKTISIDATVVCYAKSESNIEVRFYNGNPDTDDDLIPDPIAIEIGTDIININRDSSALASIDWIPSYTGSYSIYVWADPYNNIQEYNETNNLANETLEVVLVDLALSASDIQIMPPNPIMHNEPITINATIFSYDGSALNVDVKVYNGNPDVNGDLIPDPSAEMIGNDTVDVNKNDYAIASIIWIPQYRDVYNLYIWINSENTIEERNYSNNIAPAIESIIIYNWVDHFDNKDRIYALQNTNLYQGNVILTFDENATDWEYEYECIVEPDLYGWVLKNNTDSDFANVSGGLLNLNTTIENAYWRYDYYWNASNSIGVTLEAKLKVEEIGQSSDLFFFVRDGTRYEGIQFFENKIQGWYDRSLVYYMNTIDQFHYYRLTAKDNDFMVYVDGMLCINGTDRYSSSSSANVAQFGDILDWSKSYNSRSTWDYVKFNTTGNLKPKNFSDGTLTSTEIILPPNHKWDELSIDKTELHGTYINITVLDGISENPISGFENLSESIIDISSIDSYSHPSIKLMASFVSSPDFTPLLHFWAINYSHSTPPIYLEEGWNLISIPTIQNGIDIKTSLNSVEGRYDIIQWYDGNDDSDPWKHYHTAKPPSMNDLENIEHTIGFWIHIIEPNGTYLIPDGSIPSSNQYINIYAGWNLVGYPTTTTRLRNDALNNLVFGNEITIIEYYNTTTGKIESLDENEFMRPGLGYWIHAENDYVWEVPL